MGFWANRNNSQICTEMVNSQALGKAYWDTQPEHCANMIQKNEESIRTLVEIALLVYAVLLPLLWEFKERLVGNRNGFFISFPFLERNRNQSSHGSNASFNNQNQNQNQNQQKQKQKQGGGSDTENATRATTICRKTASAKGATNEQQRVHQPASPRTSSIANL